MRSTHLYHIGITSTERLRNGWPKGDEAMTMLLDDSGRVPGTSGFQRKESYSLDELEYCGRGMWGNLPRLPISPMRMLDRILDIRDEGGTFEKGYAIAEMDVRRDAWFFACHFKDDPVMPGCLQQDALWQLTGFFAGWSGARGKGRATGAGPSKFLGEILPSASLVQYRIDVKKILVSAKRSFAVADGYVECDNIRVCEISDLTAFIRP